MACHMWYALIRAWNIKEHFQQAARSGVYSSVEPARNTPKQMAKLSDLLA